MKSKIPASSLAVVFLRITLIIFSTTLLMGQNINQKPNDIFKDALAEFANGNYRQSIERLNYLLKSYPNYSKKEDVYYWLGENYKKNRNYAEALKYFYAVTIKYPKSVKCPLSKTEISQLQKHLKTGQNIFTDPKYNELLNNSFELYSKSDFASTQSSGTTNKKKDKSNKNVQDNNLSKQPIVSNVFYETDIRQALQDLSSQANIPIIPDNSVNGFVTLEINELPLETALRRILMIGGYTFKKIDNSYIVGAAEPNNPSFPLLASNESIIINYISASQAVEQLSNYYKPFVKANVATNTISVNASSEVIERIKEALKAIDIPPRQVQIEALITEVSKEDLKSVGIDWSILGTQGNRSYSIESNLSPGMIDDLGPQFSLGRNEINIKKGKLSLDIFVKLKALIEDGKADIKANPKVVTMNAQPANIAITKDQYFSVVTGPLNYPYTKLEKVSVGIFLTIKPFISESNEITINLETEVSSAIGQGREGLPLVASRKATTQVRVHDGEFIVIGGLTLQNKQKVQNKIPLLGSIPLLGYLFSYTKYEKKLTDVVILIRPHILVQN